MQNVQIFKLESDKTVIINLNVVHMDKNRIYFHYKFVIYRDKPYSNNYHNGFQDWHKDVVRNRYPS